MDRVQSRLFAIYMRGFALVFLHVAVVSVLATWVLQLLALSFDETYGWIAVLWQLYISLSFLAFFPGQNVWTYRISDAQGRLYTIVGEDTVPGTD